MSVSPAGADWRSAVNRIEQRGCRAGLALSPQTASTIVPADMPTLCMAIVPGAAGSTFDEGVLRKVTEPRGHTSTRRIGIDGGVQRRH